MLQCVTSNFRAAIILVCFVTISRTSGIPVMSACWFVLRSYGTMKSSFEDVRTAMPRPCWIILFFLPIILFFYSWKSCLLFFSFYLLFFSLYLLFSLKYNIINLGTMIILQNNGQFNGLTELHYPQTDHGWPWATGARLMELCQHYYLLGRRYSEAIIANKYMHTFLFLMELIITNHNLEKDASHVIPKTYPLPILFWNQNNYLLCSNNS